MKASAELNQIANELEQEQPTLRYDLLLAQSLRTLAERLGVELGDGAAEAFGASVSSWKPFPDTVDGLTKLRRHYKLIILSNVNNAGIRTTVAERLRPVEFDAVYTAEDIGSYKPDQKNFRYLFSHAKNDLGIDWEKGDLLHVARSLRADHVPAKELGFRSVWISRGSQSFDSNKTGAFGDTAEVQAKTAFEWQFETIGDFADEVERQFARKGAA
jgi:2-haloalkanoic acid dehalogenase type II